MADPVQDFVNTVHTQQQELGDKRQDTADALVEHMLALPGMSDIFDTDQRKQMLGNNLMIMVEMAAREKAMPVPEPPPLPPPPQNGGENV